VLVRPSYVLGGRGMEIVYDDATLRAYVRPPPRQPRHPVLIDRFLDDAIEIDVDALYDGVRAVPRRRHGAHRGGRDPLRRLGLRAAADHPRPRDIDAIREATEAIARGVGRARPAERAVRAGRPGCCTCWRPTRGRRARCRSSPRPPRCRWPRRRPDHAGRLDRRAARRGHAARVGDGGTLPLDAPIAVKEAVLPFGRFRDAGPGQGVDTVLGPEMRSTGEVMGIDAVFGTAYAKSQAAVYGSLPVKGRAFVSVANRDKRSMIFPVKRLADLGFEIWATGERRRCCAATGFVPRSCESTATVPGLTASRPW
jgi:carbamoyl-phosphate synthase large subunit